MMNKARLKRFIHAVTGISRSKWLMRPNGLYCFNYHRIGDPESVPFDPNVYSCTEQVFESHVHFYMDNFDVVNIDDVVSILESGQKITARLALITFDDGYKDNYDLAYPILKSNGASAVFFIPTNYVEGGLLPWWDEIAFMVRNSKSEMIKLSGGDEAININLKEPQLTIRDVLKIIKGDKARSLESKLVEFRVTTGVVIDGRSASELFVSWDNLREMVRGGMDIGSHTCSHRILSHLCADDQRREIVTSKKVLEKKLNTEILSLAYPVGGFDAFDLNCISLLTDSGYKLGFSFVSGVNLVLRNNCTMLRRIPVGGNCSISELKHAIAFADRVS